MADPSPYRLNVWRRLPLVLAMLVVAMLVAHVWALTWVRSGGNDPWDLHPFVTVFNADDEPSIPSWYAASSLLFAAVLVFALFRAKRDASDRDARYWRALALLCCFLSFDEVVTLHEGVEEIAIQHWQIASGVLAIVIVLAFLPFLRRLPSRTRNGFVLAAVLFIAGAVGVEYLAGPGGLDIQFESMPYVYFTAVEAGLRMFGVVVFIGALLAYMRSYQRLSETD